MKFFVYILYSKEFDKFYIGQTNDLNNRIHRHNAGFEAATSPYTPWIIIWHTEKPTRPDAMIPEKKLKNLSKERIKDFIHRHKV